MSVAVPLCLHCSRPARVGFDGCCSEVCRRAYEHGRELVVEGDRETDEGDRVAEIHHAAWRGCRRVNLQNSA